MNTVLLNTVNLDDGKIIKKGGGGVTIKNQTKSVTIAENGNTVVSYDSGYTGLENVSVKVDIPNEEKTVDITENGTTEVVADNGFLSKVVVNTNVASSGGNEGGYPIFRDGKTHYHIELVSSLSVWIYLSSTTPVNVDWGDGEIQVVESSTVIAISHTYSKYGKYVISHDGKSLGYSTRIEYVVSSHCLKAVEIGAVDYIGEGAFSECHFLEHVVFTSMFNGSTLYTNTFRQCSSLKKVVFDPRSSRLYLNSYVFSECTTLEEIDLTPFEICISQTYVFMNCYSLRKVKLLDCSGWSGIRNYTFIGCKELIVLDLSLCTSIISFSSNALTSPQYLKIVVPDALYDEWIAATNWSAYASKIIKASEFNA